MIKGTKARGMAVLCLLFVTLAGCNKQADFYVEEQESESGAGFKESGARGAETDSVEPSKTMGTGLDTSGGSDGSNGAKLEEQPEQPAGGKAAEQPEQAAAAEIYVQVCGAVVSPGVYALPAGSRIFTAIEMAGGMLPEAELSSINQAQIVSDGQMIYVCRQGEEAQSLPDGETPGAEQKDGKVNLNTASVEELMTLPGIGEAKAKSIISYREKNGGFTAPEDIMNIEGVKEGVYSKIKDHIKIN